MTINFSSKKMTWTVVLLLALLPLPSLFNYMQRFVVRNGVVTAFRYEVRAPIDGVVGYLSVVPGAIPGNKPALRLGNKRKMGQYNALELELSSLEISLDQSKKKLTEYLDKLSNDLDQSLDILNARLIGENAALTESRNHRNRTLRLVTSAVATQEDADRVESEFQIADAKVRTTKLEISQLKLRRQMLAQSMFPQDMSDGGIQVQNRINTLQQDILACKRRMSEAETGDVEDVVLLDALKENSNDRSARASIVLPDASVIWEVYVQDGLEVCKGDRLLSYIDRSRLMVEVAIDDATLELIAPGHPVRIRLFGRSDFIEGSVSRVMGAAGEYSSGLFAAEIKKRGLRDGRILVDINDDKLFNEVEKYCGVGRSAYVELEGIGLWEQYFGMFLR
jgi:multidrug resistance efflux pump